MTMREAIASRACCVEGVLKCYPHETLETVIDRIAKAEVTKAVVCAVSSCSTNNVQTLPDTIHSCL